MRHALEMLNVKKSYLKNTSEAEKALNDLTLKIPKGSVFGLLGPNGAGKSTAINILAGLTIKSGGKVQIWGHDQDVFPQKTRACLGVVPQELNLDPFLTPRESLEIQAGLFGVPKAERKTDHILTKVGLIGVSDAYSRSLSGGMRRRLLIAKALVHDPPILVLDEPTAGVDIELREMLWDYVKELNLCGTTVILTTHYLEEAERICNQIAILNKGHLVENGKTKDLLAKLDRKVLVIFPIDKITTIPVFVDGISPLLRQDGSLSLSFRKSFFSVEQVIAMCKDLGLGIKDILTEEPALEDVFRKVTKKRINR